MPQHFCMSLGWPGALSRLLRWRLTMVFLMVSALLSVQSLGLLHRLVHEPAQRTELHQIASSQHSHFLTPLFASHQNSSDCQSFDQLSHADLVVGLLPQTLALALPVFLLPFFVGSTGAHPDGLPQARGPPLVL